jgi:hypothetical protein
MLSGKRFDRRHPHITSPVRKCQQLPFLKMLSPRLSVGVREVLSMNYLLRGNTTALHNLVVLFMSACEGQGVKIPQTKATMILLKLIEDAREKGIVKELGGAFDSPEIGILENLAH